MLLFWNAGVLDCVFARMVNKRDWRWLFNNQIKTSNNNRTKTRTNMELVFHSWPYKTPNLNYKKGFQPAINTKFCNIANNYLNIAVKIHFGKGRLTWIFESDLDNIRGHVTSTKLYSDRVHDLIALYWHLFLLKLWRHSNAKLYRGQL